MGHITPELILHCVLHYMAGGSHHDIHVLAGIGKSTFFSCLHRAIDAINKCPDLALHFPSNPVNIKEVVAEFQSNLLEVPRGFYVVGDSAYSLTS
jgi:hypothetical protein